MADAGCWREALSTPSRRTSCAWRQFSRALRYCSALLVCGLRARPIGAQTEALGEYQLKAAFLFNFAKFIDWPATSFANPQAPLCRFASWERIRSGARWTTLCKARRWEIVAVAVERSIRIRRRRGTARWFSSVRRRSRAGAGDSRRYSRARTPCRRRDRRLRGGRRRDPIHHRGQPRALPDQYGCRRARRSEGELEAAVAGAGGARFGQRNDRS